MGLLKAACDMGQNWSINGKVFKEAAENNVKSLDLEPPTSLLCDPGKVNLPGL